MSSILCLGCIGTQPNKRYKECAFGAEKEFKTHVNLFHNTLKHQNGEKLTSNYLKMVVSGKITNEDLKDSENWEQCQVLAENEMAKRGISQQSLASTDLSSAPASPQVKATENPAIFQQLNRDASLIFPQVDDHFLNVSNQIKKEIDAMSDISLGDGIPKIDVAEKDYVTEPTDRVSTAGINAFVERIKKQKGLDDDWQKRYTDPNYETTLRPEHTDASRKARSEGWQSKIAPSEVDPDTLGHPANSSNYSKDSNLKKDPPSVWDGTNKGINDYMRATSEGMGDILPMPEQTAKETAEKLMKKLPKEPQT